MKTWIPSHGKFRNAAHCNFPGFNYSVNFTWICKYLRITQVHLSSIILVCFLTCLNWKQRDKGTDVQRHLMLETFDSNYSTKLCSAQECTNSLLANHPSHPGSVLYSLINTSQAIPRHSWEVSMGKQITVNMFFTCSLTYTENCFMATGYYRTFGLDASECSQACSI